MLSLSKHRHIFSRPFDKLRDLNGQLQDLPVSVAQLTRLVELNVAKNSGTLVILDMSECSRLERIYVDEFTMMDSSYNPRGNRVEIIVVR